LAESVTRQKRRAISIGFPSLWFSYWTETAIIPRLDPSPTEAGPRENIFCKTTSSESHLNHTSAVVYVELQYCGLGGGGQYYYLAKENGAWSVTDVADI